MVNYELEGKVVVVTGASSGIGRGTAVHFAQEKANLVITGRNKEALEAVEKECVEKGAAKVSIIIADLSNPADCERVMEKTIEVFGRLDVLVNNAGILVSGGIETISMADYDRQMNINARAVVHLTQLAIPHLLKSKGNIVNVSSVTGVRAFPNVVAYNVSKAAVDHLTRCVALEVAGRGVRVNAVNPGVIITEVHKRGGMGDEAYEKFLEHGKDTHAMGRVGQVSEVADAILYLASARSSFITGITLSVDGGRHAMCPR